MKEHVTQLNSVAPVLCFRQQWRSMAQRNKLYQALSTRAILVSRIDSLLVLFILGLFEKKNATVLLAF